MAIFNGPVYLSELDFRRLKTQFDDILHLMQTSSEKVNQWWTLREIADVFGYGEASISAQLRNMRKPEYGFKVLKRRRGDPMQGLWEYQLHEKCYFSEGVCLNKDCTAKQENPEGKQGHLF